MSIYRVHDATGEDLGLLEHPAPNLEPGDVLVFADGREGVVTARLEVEPGPGGGAPEVLLICPPPMGNLRQLAADFEGGFEKSRALEPAFRRVADARECAFLDAGSFVIGSDTDGVHLDRAGHATLGKAVATAVTTILH